jgi:hypothetical protein
VKGIIALTATPDRIWRPAGFWSKLRLIQLDNFNDVNYAGHNDMIFNCIDDFFDNPYIRPHPFNFEEFDEQTLGFIDKVLSKHPEILNNNTRTFIPAHVRRSGHNSVRDKVLSINDKCVVAVINGFEKTLQYKDETGNTKTLSLTSECEEVCETISRLMAKHKLEDRPLVITGFLCVGMGQTLCHESIGSFTSAIFGHLDLTNDDIYQLFGRITGRMKHWGDKYTQTQVYCPTKIMNRCQVMEECAKNMAREHNGEVVTQEQYREPMIRLQVIGKAALENIRICRTNAPKKPSCPKADDKDKDHKVFDSQAEAIKFAKDELRSKKNTRKSDIAPKELLTTDGTNPTVETLLKRFWGLSKKIPVRMVPTDGGKWCVYWRPSLINN